MLHALPTTTSSSSRTTWRTSSLTSASRRQSTGFLTLATLLLPGDAGFSHSDRLGNLAIGSQDGPEQNYG
eukprot:6193405-Pleurochrysis_carterae.AAC.8